MTRRGAARACRPGGQSTEFNSGLAASVAPWKEIEAVKINRLSAVATPAAIGEQARFTVK